METERFKAAGREPSQSHTNCGSLGQINALAPKLMG